MATEFGARIELTGLVLTKLDGDARGGGALSIRSVTGVPIKFMSSTERIEPLEVFHPDRLASRILGMGDVVTLVEKAQEVIDVESAAAMEEKFRKATFGLDDFLDQLDQVKRMGAAQPRARDGARQWASLPRTRISLRRYRATKWPVWRAIIRSMTPEERSYPEIIDGSRRRRIAAGSGTQPRDVNQLLNQFRQMRKNDEGIRQRKKCPTFPECSEESRGCNGSEYRSLPCWAGGS